jgi:hypothetical protein
MALKFNPFTGTFDFTGSGGGGGSAFFAGEVATYADLPLDGTAALNSRWLVRSSSGTWPFPNYRQGGIYIRTSIVGASRDNDYTLADTKLPDVFADSAFLLYDNSDSTRNLQFDLGSITTGTTRTLTVPDASGRIQVEGQPIGNTTPAAGTFTTLAANNGTLTASAPVLNLAQTWNASGTLFTALNLNVTDTASAANSMFARIQRGGSTVFEIRKGPSTAEGAISLLLGGSGFGNIIRCRTGGFVGLNFAAPIVLDADQSLVFNSTNNATDGGDLFVRRDGADTLAQRRSTNAQTFRIYNTFTDATNHERGFLRWSSNVFQIGTEKGSGGGTARALEFQTDGVTRLSFTTGGNTQLAAGFSLVFAERVRLIPSGNDGILRLANIGDNGFDRLQFGGTTTSFPALKRSSATLQVRLADDSAFAGFSCGALTLNGNLDASTRDIVTDTTTGTKIGTGTTQKIGFFNATPVVQQAAVADATDAASTQARLNDLLARLRTLGLIAT